MSKKNIIYRLAIFIFLLVPWLFGEIQDQVEIHSPLKAVKKVIPDYPDRLKREGIEGAVLICISINPRGSVTLVTVCKSLHPELDRLTVEAFKKWKFEPFIHEGEPIHAAFFVWVFFNLGTPAENNEGPSEPEPLSQELRMVLDKCADYCQKLSTSALYYVCQEKIVETKKKLISEEGGMVMMAGRDGLSDLKPNEIMNVPFAFPALQGAGKSRCVYDYQLIRREGKVEEKRVLLEENGKKAGEETTAQEACGLCTLKPILMPIRLLGREQQSLFSYQMAREEKVRGKAAYVILAKCLRGKGEDIRSGKIWVDKTGFRILKVEIETSSLAGYEQFLKECSPWHLKPQFTSVHYYETEKNGLLFPSRSEVRVEYMRMFRPETDMKYEAEVHYENYRFFTVETESGFKDIKKLAPKPFPTPMKNLLAGSIARH